MTLCNCNEGFYEDRYINKTQKGCPACDPEMGDNVEDRKNNYKMLISHPVPDEILNLFGKTND